MKNTPALSLILLAALVLIPAGAAGAVGTAGDTAFPGLLLSTVLTNLGIAFSVVLLFIFGLYAYANLARFAPYHSWVYLYLVSLTGIVWSVFLVDNGGSMADVTFILTTVVGINLIVHVLRFDRIEITAPGRAAGVSLEQRAQENNPLLNWTPPRF